MRISPIDQTFRDILCELKCARLVEIVDRKIVVTGNGASAGIKVDYDMSEWPDGVFPVRFIEVPEGVLGQIER